MGNIKIMIMATIGIMTFIMIIIRPMHMSVIRILIIIMVMISL